jgi:hypothetical protein
VASAPACPRDCPCGMSEGLSLRHVRGTVPAACPRDCPYTLRRLRMFVPIGLPRPVHASHPGAAS